MKRYRLDDMKLGWFVGNFSPSVLTSEAFEVAVKYYEIGDYEELHHHKISTEITVIVAGKVTFNDKVYSKGDIIVIPPGESVKFQALESSITTVVKTPSVLYDKYQG